MSWWCPAPGCRAGHAPRGGRSPARGRSAAGTGWSCGLLSTWPGVLVGPALRPGLRPAGAGGHPDRIPSAPASARSA
eukprot:4338152-Alexandrium_andersonii.AAC.1